MVPIRCSSRRSTLETISCSLSWNTPASAPCSISTLISSSVTGGSPAPRALKGRSNTSPEVENSQTSGRVTFSSQAMGRASTEAIRSGASKARRLGTSSPITTEK